MSDKHNESSESIHVKVHEDLGREGKIPEEEEWEGSGGKEPSKLSIIGEAIAVAKKAFEDYLSSELDPSYFRLSMEVEVRDYSFTETLEKLIYKDLS